MATSLLDDVALARAVKQSGRKILFRYAGDAVRTRMYRSFPQLREGWTKNLALLFPWPGWLAAWRGLEFLLVTACLAFIVVAISNRDYLHAILYAVLPVFTFLRIRRAHFSWDANALSLLGLPLFSYLLLRSKIAYGRGDVSWKGRTYPGAGQDVLSASRKQESNGLSHAQS